MIPPGTFTNAGRVAFPLLLMAVFALTGIPSAHAATDVPSTTVVNVTENGKVWNIYTRRTTPSATTTTVTVLAILAFGGAGCYALYGKRNRLP